VLLGDLRDALNVLLQYDEGEVDAGACVVYLHPGDLQPPDMDPPDVRRLEALGWQWDIGRQCWRRSV
jgi:hypothetical protein